MANNSDLDEIEVVRTDDIEDTGIDIATAVFEPADERDLNITMQSDGDNASATDTTTSGKPVVTAIYKYVSGRAEVYYGRVDPSVEIAHEDYDKEKKDKILAKSKKSKEVHEKEEMENSERQ